MKKFIHCIYSLSSFFGLLILISGCGPPGLESSDPTPPAVVVTTSAPSGTPVIQTNSYQGSGTHQ